MVQTILASVLYFRMHKAACHTFFYLGRHSTCSVDVEVIFHTGF